MRGFFIAEKMQNKKRAGDTANKSFAGKNEAATNENAVNFAETKKSKGGLRRLIDAFLYTCAGFKAAFKHEHACRQEIFAFCVLTIVVIALPIDAFSKAMLFVPMPLILGFEMLNSAIEAVVDDISLEYRELAKRAKDLGSAAVFCAMVIGAVVWIAVLAKCISAGDFDGWAQAVCGLFSAGK